MLAEAADANGIYEEALESLRASKFADGKDLKGTATNKKDGKDGSKPKISEREREMMAMDYYADVRTNVLLAWVLSNVCGWHGSSFLHTLTRVRVSYYYSYSREHLPRVHLTPMLIYHEQKHILCSYWHLQRSQAVW